MSYLVDALKKAERDRHENQRADLRSLAEGGPPTGGMGSGHALRWLVGMLVVCNAALLVYLFVPTGVSQAFVEAPQAAPEKTPQKTAGEGGTADDQNKAPVSSAAPVSEKTANSGRIDNPQRESPRVAPQREQTSISRSVVETPGSARTPDSAPSSPTLPPSNRQDMASLRLSGDQRGSGGQVTYSDTPLDGDPATRSAPARAEGAGGSAPAVAINGHLYSTVPGRSFILVNGRRYHEGERLAEGPAVETIDATGATLNYRGDRYHVKGPS